MFYWLYQKFSGSREEWVILRAAAAIMCGFLIVLLSGNRVIRWLLRQKVGDRPEFHNATLNELTKHKGNTPCPSPRFGGCRCITDS